MGKFEGFTPEPEKEDDWTEPQAEEAVEMLKNKGYKIGTLAGQAGMVEKENKQAIVFERPHKKPGENPFDEITMQALKTLGVRTYSGALPVDMIGIEFTPATDDVEEIRKKWNEIAEILPDIDSSD